jgi:ribosome maturation factor RimP
MSDRELEQIQETIEGRLRGANPEVELLALDRPAAERLRLVIDHPDGVDLALCEAVTRLLDDLNERWSLEVSSPGPERPLTKPEHFERFLGHRVRVKTREEIDGHRSFTGLLQEAGSDEISLAGEDGAMTIPMSAVRRSHLLAEETSDGRPAPADEPDYESANGGGLA